MIFIDFFNHLKPRGVAFLQYISKKILASLKKILSQIISKQLLLSQLTLLRKDFLLMSNRISSNLSKILCLRGLANMVEILKAS